ncbi:hypothetical protein A2U01_0012590, partial [Trifolium medium]|nr:hypothetical protein [Trifolium medium]
LVGNSVEDYHVIHFELTIELNKHKERYLALFGSQGRFNEAKHALTPAGIDPTLEDKWMIMFEMRFLLA